MKDWEIVLQEIEQSGKSIAQYCKETNLKPHTIRYWKQKQRAAKTGFIGIKTNIESSAIELIYPNGVKLKLQAGAALPFLKSLINV